MGNWQFTKGLHELGNGNFAYLQPTGTWGFSNAGLVIDGDQSLLVDTLFDERMTGDMLKTMKDATGIGGADIQTLINTHANGDHTYGNNLCTRAEIIASKASAEEMAEEPPEMLVEYLKLAPSMGEVGEFLLEIFGGFDFAGVTQRAPTQTFSGELNLKVGDKHVHVLEVGPAHTHGDVLVHVPDDGVVYTGDILFIEGTPIMWAGPIRNWIKACDKIIEWKPAAIVPGHGPITDIEGVVRVRDYLSYVERETRKRYEAGLSAEDAAFDIALNDYSAWEGPERICVTVAMIYRELSGDTSPTDVVSLFTQMARMRKDGLRA